MGICASAQAQKQAKITQTLEKTPFSHRLTKEELEEFGHIFELRSYRKGQVITDVTSPPEFFIVVEGKVDVEYDGHFLTSKGTNSFFGAIALNVASVIERKESLYRNSKDFDLEADGGKPKNLGRVPLTKRESEIDAQRLSTVRAAVNTVCLVTSREGVDSFLETLTESQRDFVEMTMGSAMSKNLTGIDFLKDVPDRKLQILSNLLIYVPLRKGEVLFQEGSLGSEMYIVYQGGCQAVAKRIDEETGESHDVVLNSFQEGDFFGEISLIMDMPRTASIIASEDTLVLELRKDDFHNFLKLTPNLHFHDLMKRRFANHFRKYKVPFFSAIPEAKYPMLASLCKVEQIEEDTIVFKEGEIGNSFYIIAHGEVVATTEKCASTLNKDKKKVGEIIELSRMGPGKYFGEIALIRDTKRTATVKTVTRCVILSITKKNFDQFFADAPEALADFEVKLARYDVAMRSVIYHPLGLNYFTKFLEREFSDENIKFWNEARDYRHITEDEAGPLVRAPSEPDDITDIFKSQNKYILPSDPRVRRASLSVSAPKDGSEISPILAAKLLQKAVQIVEAYIAEDSKTPVNVMGDTRTEIEKKVTEGDVDHSTFITAEKEILDLLERDSFARFKQSDLFSEFLQDAESYDEKEQDPAIALSQQDPRLRSGSHIEDASANEKKEQALAKLANRENVAVSDDEEEQTATTEKIAISVEE